MPVSSSLANEGLPPPLEPEPAADLLAPFSFPAPPSLSLRRRCRSSLSLSSFSFFSFFSFSFSFSFPSSSSASVASAALDAEEAARLPVAPPVTPAAEPTTLLRMARDLDRPKSEIFAKPYAAAALLESSPLGSLAPSETSRLPGFRSRWITTCACLECR